MHGEIRLGTRMNYYPSCSRPNLGVGVSPHSDGSSFTFLPQDDEITSLQIKHHRRWVPVKPIPNAIVVNIGDVVDSWSNGMYKSIEHRAVISEKKARISIATFVLPEDETTIGPVPRGVASCQPKMYKNIKYVDYIRCSLSRKMDGKANIEYLKV
ncbi:codeine O-demethylase-like [Syzygium oleosum]|uniref:codeine O-demethylase-like n=1 Tax=Syzygium oleosum TaxID=219896 RepID=UPI0011D2BEF3|nr:codeine O-demethylase-like [Syzygium oleosum]